MTVRPPYDEPQMAHGAGYDLRTAEKMIEERWVRYYPLMPYYPLVKAVTPVGASTELLSGELGTTAFDPLYGEAIDRPVGTTEWRQPHLSQQSSESPVTDPARAAAEPEVRDTAYALHIRITRVTRESELKKLGFDLVRTLVACVPTSFYVRLGLKPQVGDRFRWNDELYEVLQTVPQGWYKNTTHNLYWYLSVKSARLGS